MGEPYRAHAECRSPHAVAPSDGATSRGAPSRLPWKPNSRGGGMSVVQSRKLGRPGIEFSDMAFAPAPTAGLMVYGTPAEQTAAVKHAYELGITYFDTAPI